MVRKKLRALICWLSSIASPNDAIMVSGTVKMAYTMVFHSACRNFASPNRSVKFFSPTNSIGFAQEPSHFRNARTTAITIGTSVKTAKPIKFGAMKLYATRLSLRARCCGVTVRTAGAGCFADMAALPFYTDKFEKRKARRGITRRAQEKRR